MYSFDFSKGAMLYLTYGKLKKSNSVKKADRRSGRLSFQDFFIFILWSVPVLYIYGKSRTL